MEQNVTLNNLPLIFRKDISNELANSIVNRRSIVLVGTKRVGIGSYLGYFINRKDVLNKYVAHQDKYLFIPVDMNDLVECEIAPFWTLTLKRIVDAVENSVVKEETKKEIRELFLESIQLQDLFFTIDSIRLSIKKIIDQGLMPTLFFIRFDRLKNTLTPEFFANLEGLRDFTHQQLSYIFTSFLPLSLFTNVLNQSTQVLLYKNIYFKPAGAEDEEIIYNAYKKRYNIRLAEDLEKYFLELVGGHFQYLQLGLISLHAPSQEINTAEDLKAYLLSDERIRLQSEELWESLSPDEQKILIRISKGEKLTDEEKTKHVFLWDIGFIQEKKETHTILNRLFEYFVREHVSEEAKDNGVEFSKKELLFFEYLKNNLNTICEREKIIDGVWPEASELGISDWAIDKLAARVRTKLKLQNNNYELQTIKTRGFKLIES